MGILLFKGNTNTSAIDDIRVSNQQLTFNKFRNPERTITKTLTTYQSREKLEAELQFQYENDEYYRRLRRLFDDRSLIQEGLLFMPVPYSDSKSVTLLEPAYDPYADPYCSFQQVSYMKDDTENEPWLYSYDTLLSTEFSEAQYDAIASTDSATSVTITPGTGKYGGVCLGFDVNSFMTIFDRRDLRRLTLSWLGLSKSPLRFFVWSPTSNTWYNIHDEYYYNSSDLPLTYKQSVAQFCLPQGYTSIADDFINDDGKIKFLVCNQTTAGTLLMKHVRLLLNGYYVIPESPEDIENYALHFTGAGRTGQIKLLEI